MHSLSMAKVAVGKLVSLSLVILLVVAKPELFVYFIFILMMAIMFVDLLPSKIEAKPKVINVEQQEVIKLYPDGVLQRMQNLKQFKK